jgi:hypothetical protein
MKKPASSCFFCSPFCRTGDVRRAAKILSCNQDIAADGAFSLGMIAEFDEKIADRGDWWYPRIFWYESAA